MQPYENLPTNRFWPTAVAGVKPGAWTDLYTPKFAITPETAVSTAGSCFAQHIGRQLRARSYNYCDFELPPPLLPAEAHAEFGYGLFSARFGNIYTARQLLQLAQRAYGLFEPATRAWTDNGRVYDPFRPSIEKGGFESEDELAALRDTHFAAVRRMIETSEVFVFTLGLTEAWLAREDGAVYPVCPGTVAGRFNPAEHVFANFGFREVHDDMNAFIALARERNPNLRFLLTVSPVPLTATASGEHVLAATIYSKSILRAVAGQLSSAHEYVDYFPSYEMVASPASRGGFFAANLRSVTDDGVASVMACFFGEAPEAAPVVPKKARKDRAADRLARELTLVCDEEELDPVAGE